MDAPYQEININKIMVKIRNKIEIFNYNSLYIIIIITTIITSVINFTVLNGQGLINGQVQIKGIVITNNKTISLMYLS